MWLRSFLSTQLLLLSFTLKVWLAWLSFISALPTVTAMELVWKRHSSVYQDRKQTFPDAQMITFRITVNLHFPEKCIRDRRVGKGWLLSRELPVSWGEDIFSPPKEANQRKKTSQQVGLETVLAFVAWQTVMGDSRAPQGPARPPLSIHIVSLSSTARLRVKAFRLPLGRWDAAVSIYLKNTPKMR